MLSISTYESDIPEVLRAYSNPYSAYEKAYEIFSKEFNIPIDELKNIRNYILDDGTLISIRTNLNPSCLSLFAESEDGSYEVRVTSNWLHN